MGRNKKRTRGSGSIFQRGKTWYIAYYVNGEQIKEKIGTSPLVTKGQAELALKARLGEVVQDRYKLEKAKNRIRLSKLIEQYMNWITENQKGYSREVTISKHFLEFIGDKYIDSISTWDIEKYKSKRKQDGMKPSTVNRELNMLRSMFNRAVEWGEVEKNPLDGVKKLKPLKAEDYERKPLCLPNDKFHTILKASSPNLKNFLIVAKNTGMRVSELINLRWTDINFEVQQIKVKESKNFTQRYVPMNNTVINALELLDKSDEKVFPYKSRNSVSSTWRKVKERLGFKQYRLHDLRHTFITDLVTSGVDIITIMEITGHKDIRMLKRYTHPTISHKLEAVKKIENAPNNPTTIPSKKVGATLINVSG